MLKALLSSRSLNGHHSPEKLSTLVKSSYFPSKQWELRALWTRSVWSQSGKSLEIMRHSSTITLTTFRMSTVSTWVASQPSSSRLFNGNSKCNRTKSLLVVGRPLDQGAMMQAWITDNTMPHSMTRLCPSSSSCKTSSTKMVILTLMVNSSSTSNQIHSNLTLSWTMWRLRISYCTQTRL